MIMTWILSVALVAATNVWSRAFPIDALWKTNRIASGTVLFIWLITCTTKPFCYVYWDYLKYENKMKLIIMGHYD